MLENWLQTGCEDCWLRQSVSLWTSHLNSLSLRIYKMGSIYQSHDEDQMK